MEADLTRDESPWRSKGREERIIRDAGGNILTLCMLGATGAGKSSLCNSLFGCRSDDLFQVGQDMESTTSETTASLFHWRGQSDKVRCVDTPGFMDSRGGSHDVKQAEAMVHFLKTQVKHVHVFLLLFRRTDNIMSKPLKDMLTTFKNMFGNGFIESVIIGFTHWEYTDRAKRQEQNKKVEMNKELRKIFEHNFDCPCVFVDNALNSLCDEELRAEFSDGLEDAQQQFERELQKILAFMKGEEPYIRPGIREPFFCDGVEAVMDKEQAIQGLRERSRQGQFYHEGRLGRCLNHWNADSDVIHQGPLRWCRQWSSAVLKRQKLLIYNKTGGNIIKSLDLTGCICFPVHASAAHMLSKYFRFAICRPVPDEFGDRYHEEICVHSDDERRRWMLLVLEASQITDSWHRIHVVHENLRLAKDKREYVEAIEQIESKTVVIPIVWVESLIGHSREPSSKELHGDLKRDSLMVNGRRFAKENGVVNIDALTAEVAYHILESIRSKQVKESGEWDSEKEACSEARAMILARDVVMSCSRTFGQGDSFAAVLQLFGTTDLVGVAPAISAEDTVRVSVMSTNSSRAAINELKSSLGVPQFEGETNSRSLTIEAVQKMSLEGEQRLEATMVSADKWIQDWEANQCMWCSVPFNTWLRRHHCRACGAIVCFSCSQHSLTMGTEETEGGSLKGGTSKRGRACWLCYKEAAIVEVNNRKLIARNDASQQDEEHITDCGDEEEGNGISSGGVGADELELPLVNVEMSFKYRIHDMNPTSESDATWFWLDCKYMRVVRWSGLADEGRVIISITAA
eukprot:TRINITY_DN27753_c0_g1_i1.p1 TRINITY_DN27753_c0_g1~~TRINITY_DN27753_c0_g1_i1.p1  ORF type:complete len:838 (-),score=132.43 TRINITY_DN27753_c0_g1_i1:240-2639(-)